MTITGQYSFNYVKHQPKCNGLDLCRTTGNNIGLPPTIIKAANQTTINPATGAVDGPFDRAIMLQKLLAWVVLTDQPMSSVAQESLKDLLLYCNKGAVTVSALTMRRSIEELYADLKSQNELELAVRRPT